MRRIFEKWHGTLNCVSVNIVVSFNLYYLLIGHFEIYYRHMIVVSKNKRHKNIHLGKLHFFPVSLIMMTIFDFRINLFEQK